ncbi:MAG: DMT family transporter [Sneathiellaceae bacterium]
MTAAAAPDPAPRPVASRVGVLAGPAIFVGLWSTGFIAAGLALPYSGALTFLALRFVLVVPLLAGLALLAGARWPSGLRNWLHLAIAGVLVQAVYLGGVFIAIGLGLGPAETALIVSLHPVVVAVLAGPMLGERVIWRQWLGLALGLAGVALVVADGLSGNLALWTAYLACGASLAGIALGTLYQKRFCGSFDLRTGNAVQFMAAGLVALPLAWGLEGLAVTWSADFAGALVWAVLVLSIGAISLLYWMLRRGAATAVSSLFFMVPPVTALMSWAIFGESFGLEELAGMLLAVTGVALAQARTGGRRKA